jgi:hypothetical protein
MPLTSSAGSTRTPLGGPPRRVADRVHRSPSRCISWRSPFVVRPVDSEWRGSHIAAKQSSATSSSQPRLCRELVPTSVPTFPWRRETPGYALKRLTYWNL